MVKHDLKRVAKSRLARPAAVLGTSVAIVLALPIVDAISQRGIQTGPAIMASANAAEGNAQAAGDPAAGKTKFMACAICHGANGEGTGTYPKVAGLSSAEAQKRLQELRTKNPYGPHGSLSDADIADLSAYIATL